MTWIVAWCSFAAVMAYNYGGIGAAVTSFIVWFAVLFGIRLAYFYAQVKKEARQ